MTLSFVPWKLAFLAWIAWIPLLMQLLPIDRSKKCAHPLRLGFICGVLYWLYAIFWIVHVSIVGMILLSVYLALFLGVWTWLIDRLQNRWSKVSGTHHLLIATIGSSSWIALEWIRGWLFGGFTWNFTGVSQFQNILLIQMASLTGVYGISFIVLFVNFTLWLTYRRLVVERFSPHSWRYEFSVGMGLLAIVLGIGLRSILRHQRDPAASQHLKVALVQPNIPQEVKFEPLSAKQQLDRLERATQTAATLKPDVVIWPETAMPKIRENFSWIQQLIQRTHIPILLGTLGLTRTSTSAPPGFPPHFGPANSAILFDSQGGLSGIYHKRHLVPFGEYIPFEQSLPFMKYTTPVGGSMIPGREATLFRLQGQTFGVVICFEDTLPMIVRDLALENVDYLINLTNDAWFKDSFAAEMHAANAVIRSVETRKPLIRCTNHGWTLVVSPLGQIMETLPPFTEGVMIREVPCRPSSTPTFYTRWGDWFPKLCLSLALLAWGTTYFTKVTPSHPSP